MFRLYGRLIPRNRKKQNQPLSGGKERESRPFFSQSGQSAALRTGRERLPFPSGVCGLQSAVCSLQFARDLFFLIIRKEIPISGSLLLLLQGDGIFPQSLLFSRTHGDPPFPLLSPVSRYAENPKEGSRRESSAFWLRSFSILFYRNKMEMVPGRNFICGFSPQKKVSEGQGSNPLGGAYEYKCGKDTGAVSGLC